MRDLLSIRDLSKNDVDHLIEDAFQFKRATHLEGLLFSIFREAGRFLPLSPLDRLSDFFSVTRISYLTPRTLFPDEKIASLFFEDSTRTRTSSEEAVRNLGCQVIGFAGPEGTSVKKGEPLADTVRMFAGYGCDAIVMRHNLEGASRFAAKVLDPPVVNGGDGAGEHPTQALLDLMTFIEGRVVSYFIKKGASDTREAQQKFYSLPLREFNKILEEVGDISGMRIAFVGDAKNGRTIHSNLQLQEFFDTNLSFVNPPSLAIAPWRLRDYQEATGREVPILNGLEEAIRSVDAIYVTRIQRERFGTGRDADAEYDKVSGIYEINPELLAKGSPNLMVMHPLPRYKHRLEIKMSVDNTPYCWFLEEARNGVFMRMAIFKRVLRFGFEGRTKECEDLESWEDLSISDGAKQGENFLYRLTDGTLIDHITPGKGLEVLNKLGLGYRRARPIVPALGIRSQKYGEKDVLAIHGEYLTPDQLYLVCLISPTATINLIREGKVFKKGRVNLPPVLENVVYCNNPNCISQPDYHEHAGSRMLVEKRDTLKLRCDYCGEPIEGNEIRLT